jgi:8-oxo-dGTP pyrophosphatase MutT (NUDIX family)
MKRRKAMRRINAGKKVVQVAALPYRYLNNGEMEVLIITSRQTGQFILPKGWPMNGKSDPEAAAEEAEQEAGVVGKPGKRAIGKLRRWERLRDLTIPVEIDVYPLKVHTELKTWREKDQRVRRWLKPEHAIAVLSDRKLADLVSRARNHLPADVMSTKIRAARRVRRFRTRPSRRIEIAGRAQLRLGTLRDKT